MVPASPAWWKAAAVALAACGAALGAAAAPLGTAITYQGTLASGGAPADGVYDLRFRLLDAADGGTELGVVTLEDQAVSAGMVTAVLDFGDVFDGTALWLQLEVRDGASTGAYTVIAPRQALRAHPRALYALAAGHARDAVSALTADDALTVDGLDAAALRAWAGLTGVPPELADGDDDTLAVLPCAPGQVPLSDGAAWACGEDQAVDLARTVVIGPVGTPAANGAALLAAMAALPTPADREEGFVLQLEPGLYDLGGATLQMKPWVVLAGAGQPATVITSSVCDEIGNEATVVAMHDVTVRDLTVESTCGDPDEYGVALLVPASAESARISRVTVRATGANYFSVALAIGGASTSVDRVTASSSGATMANTAIACSASTTLTDSTGTATGGAFTSGLTIASPSAVAPTRALVSRGTYTASGGSASYGVRVASASADLSLLTVSGDAAGLIVDNTFGTNEVHVEQMISTGPVVDDLSGGDLTLTIQQSRIMAPSASPTIASVGLTSDVRVAATQLLGGAASASAACAGVWDEHWIFYPSTCP